MNKKFNENKIVYAGFWIRFLSHIIDTIVFSMGILIISAAMGFIFGIFSLNDGISLLNNVSIISNILSLLLIGLIIHLWIKYGKTPGKQILGIEIVDADTFDRIVLSKGTLRYLGYFLSTLTLGIGYIMVAFTKRKQGLHDFVGNTVVVYSNSLIEKQTFVDDDKNIIENQLIESVNLNKV